MNVLSGNHYLEEKSAGQKPEYQTQHLYELLLDGKSHRTDEIVEKSYGAAPRSPESTPGFTACRRSTN